MCRVELGNTGAGALSSPDGDYHLKIVPVTAAGNAWWVPRLKDEKIYDVHPGDMLVDVHDATTRDAREFIASHDHVTLRIKKDEKGRSCATLYGMYRIAVAGRKGGEITLGGGVPFQFKHFLFNCSTTPTSVVLKYLNLIPPEAPELADPSKLMVIIGEGTSATGMRNPICQVNSMSWSRAAFDRSELDGDADYTLAAKAAEIVALAARIGPVLIITKKRYAREHANNFRLMLEEEGVKIVERVEELGSNTAIFATHGRLRGTNSLESDLYSAIFVVGDYRFNPFTRYLYSKFGFTEAEIDALEIGDTLQGIHRARPYFHPDIPIFLLTSQNIFPGDQVVKVQMSRILSGHVNLATIFDKKVENEALLTPDETGDSSSTLLGIPTKIGDLRAPDAIQVIPADVMVSTSSNYKAMTINPPCIAPMGDNLKRDSEQSVGISSQTPRELVPAADNAPSPAIKVIRKFLQDSSPGVPTVSSAYRALKGTANVRKTDFLRIYKEEIASECPAAPKTPEAIGPSNESGILPGVDLEYERMWQMFVHKEMVHRMNDDDIPGMDFWQRELEESKARCGE